MVVPTILIVDDEQQIRSLLSTTFSRAGFLVSTASSGNDAIGCFAEKAFDVVLSDVRMPGMNGHELVQWIAVHQPHTRTVLMTGYNAESEINSYSPRCTVLTKPFKPLDVVDAVKNELAS